MPIFVKRITMMGLKGKKSEKRKPILPLALIVVVEILTTTKKTDACNLVMYYLPVKEKA